MRETFLEVDDEYMFVRHNELKPGRTTLLFVHGLGDSGLEFEDAFRYRQLDDYNIIVPDLIGYGRSSSRSEQKMYGFDFHIRRLWQLTGETNTGDLVVIGHSMGADVATLMCGSDHKGVIKKCVNIEGDITQFDLFISGQAAKAHEDGRFETWFEEFRHKTVYSVYGKVRSGRLYYASMCFCRPRAFLEDAIELVARATSESGKYTSEMGSVLCALKIPSVFCYGTRSLSDESLAFVEANGLITRRFEGVGHCPMTDRNDEFYPFLGDFIR